MDSYQAENNFHATDLQQENIILEMGTFSSWSDFVIIHRGDF